MLLGSTQPLT